MFDPTPEVENFSAYAFTSEMTTHMSLDDYIGKYVVLLFLPMDETREVSLGEARAFQPLGQDDTVVLGIIPKSKEEVASLMEKPFEAGGLKGVSYPILCDESKAITNSFEAESESGVSRCLCIIGRHRHMRYKTVYHRYVGRHVGEAERVLNVLRECDRIRHRHTVAVSGTMETPQEPPKKTSGGTDEEQMNQAGPADMTPSSPDEVEEAGGDKAVTKTRGGSKQFKTVQESKQSKRPSQVETGEGKKATGRKSLPPPSQEQIKMTEELEDNVTLVDETGQPDENPVPTRSKSRPSARGSGEKQARSASAAGENTKKVKSMIKRTSSEKEAGGSKKSQTNAAKEAGAEQQARGLINTKSPQPAAHEKGSDERGRSGRPLSSKGPTPGGAEGQSGKSRPRNSNSRDPGVKGEVRRSKSRPFDTGPGADDAPPDRGSKARVSKSQSPAAGQSQMSKSRPLKASDRGGEGKMSKSRPFASSAEPEGGSQVEEKHLSRHSRSSVKPNAMEEEPPPTRGGTKQERGEGGPSKSKNRSIPGDKSRKSSKSQKH